MKRITYFMLLMLFFASYTSTQAQKNDDSLGKDTYYTLKEALKKPKDVYILDISSEDVEGFFREIGKFTNLTSLYMTKGNLTSLPKEIGILVNLKELNLSNNKLTNLPKEIGNLIDLNYLNLQNNQIKSIPKEIKKLKKLRSYPFQTDTFPDGIENLVGIKEINLNTNLSLDALHKLNKMPNLTELHIGKIMPANIKKLKHITNIHITTVDSLDLSEVFNVLSQMPKLKYLKVYSEKTTIIPKEISKMTNLDSLQLLVRAKELPIEMAKLVSLKYLFALSTTNKTYPKVISALKNLEDLGIVTNNEDVKNLLDCLATLPNLQKLSLASTSAMQSGGGYLILPPEIGKLTNLREITFQPILFVELPIEFTNLIHLKKIESGGGMYSKELDEMLIFLEKIGYDRDLNPIKK